MQRIQALTGGLDLDSWKVDSTKDPRMGAASFLCFYKFW